MKADLPPGCSLARLTGRALLALSCGAALLAAAQSESSNDMARWWAPDEDRTFPRELDYPNAHGSLRILHDGEPVKTKGHPFFTALGPNGRACVSCHQPADAMSLSVQSIQQRWEETQGKDPIFAAFDGSNCPTAPQDARASHSLLLDHGLFRIQRPWPPRDWSGNPVKPDFDIAVVRDPTGCNTGTPMSPSPCLHAGWHECKCLQRRVVAKFGCDRQFSGRITP